MFSVGQHSVKVDPKVSQMTCSFNHSSIQCDCWHWFPAALLSRLHHNVCALTGLMRDSVSRHHLDTLPSCTALVASLESFDVLYMSPSSASVRILLGPFWFRSTRPLVYTLKRTGESDDSELIRSRAPVSKQRSHCSFHERSCNPPGQC